MLPFWLSFRTPVCGMIRRVRTVAGMGFCKFLLPMDLYRKGAGILPGCFCARCNQKIAHFLSMLSIVEILPNSSVGHLPAYGAAVLIQGHLVGQETTETHATPLASPQFKEQTNLQVNKHINPFVRIN